MLSHLLRLYSYNAWANGLVLDKIKSMKNPDETLTKIFSHILAAERLWLARIQGSDTSTIQVWPEYSLDELDKAALENRRMINNLMVDMTNSDLETEITYVNTKGIEYHTAVKDILTHLALHGGYHRGQLAREMRRSGTEPVNTDFITFVREGG